MSLAAVPDNPDAQALGQQPPHDLDAEQAVVGAMLLSREAIAEAGSVLAAADFYRPAHQTVFTTITGLAARGDPTDAVAVSAELTRTGDITRTGGAPYLHTCIEAVPAVANAGYYAGIVADLARRRTIVATGQRLLQIGATGDGDTADLFTVARNHLSGAEVEDPLAWPEPTPLDAAFGVLPVFPLAALPGWVGAYAGAVSGATQTPPDPAGCLALAALSVAASGRVWVDSGIAGWKEPACIYTVVAMPPGSRKSAVFSAMNAPLFAAEKKLITAAKPQITEAQLTLRVANAAADQAAVKAEKEQSPEAIAEATEQAAAAADLDVPAVPQLLASDVTPENLATRLAAQQGRIALLDAEGGFFGTLAGRYSGGVPNLDTFLKAHASDAIRVDRSKRDSDIITNPALTVGIALQPEALNAVFATPGGRGRGLLARVLYALPTSTVGYRSTKNARPVPPETEDLYTRQLQSLLYSMRAMEEPATLALTREASQALAAIVDEDVEVELRPQGRFSHLVDWGAKYAGAILRIAALLHLAEHLTEGWGRPIDLETLYKAYDIGEYYAQHALAVFGLMGADPVHHTARKALDWLANQDRRQFTKREIFAAIRDRDISQATHLDEPLALLADLGWIRPLAAAEKKGPGRKPSPTYLVHPHLGKEQ